MLQEKSKNDEDIQKRLTVLQQATERAENLTRQLMLFSKNDHLELTPLSPNRLIERLVPMLQNALGSKIKTYLKLGENIPLIRADEVKLCQVLVNLSANARDAMPKGGELIFTTEYGVFNPPGSVNSDAKKYVRISIIDSGSGIAAENIDRVFDPFFTTRDVSEWKGLGLSVAYGIMKGHNGEIIVESEAGKGTTIHLFFEALAETVEKNAVPDIKDPSQIPVPKGGNILVVDDEAMIRESLSDILKFLGYNVYIADGGNDALRIIRSNGDIHVAIIDFEMPGMDGIETINAIKQIDENIKIILSSGFANQEKVASVHENIQAFLPKPFQMDDLSETMEQILKN